MKEENERLTEKSVVLIVDDEPTNIQVLAVCLKDDYQLKIAKSAEQAISIVEGDVLPDLILLDIEMPGMNGHDLCKKLQSQTHTRQIPIIFITARTEEVEEELGLSLGAVDYITKPIRPAIVKARVKTHVTLKKQRDRLASMAMYDQLTGLFNRYYLFEVADQKLAKAQRYQQGFSVMVIDVDHFKKINDNHGHAVGDEVLRSLSAMLASSFRKEDVAARLGGEEFVVLLDQCPRDEAKQRAQRLCQDIAGTPMCKLDVTCSIGVAELNGEDDTFAMILNRADEALYEAKHAGRNNVQLSE